MSEWLWGVHAVREALQAAGRRVDEVWVEEGPRSAVLERLEATAGAAGVRVRRVDASTFAGLELGDAQRVAARCGPFGYRDEPLPAAAAGLVPCLVVVLDHITDPQNVGAIARTAEAVGCRALCIPRRRAAAITPAVVHASAGAVEHLGVHRIANVARTVGELKAAGYWTVALSAAGEHRWDQVDYRGCVALVVGSEGRGVHRLVAERCDFRVALPMHGRVDSLNVSAAFAACAYEALRQQLGVAGG